MNYNFSCKDNCNKEHVKNWFRMLMLYLNVKIDLSKLIINLMDGG